MTIGEKIRKARKLKGLTQKQLADCSEINVGTIRKYELGLRNPKSDQLKKIANALNISFLLLIDFEIIELLESLLEKTDYSFFESDKSILINFRDENIQSLLKERDVKSNVKLH